MTSHPSTTDRHDQLWSGPRIASAITVLALFAVMVGCMLWLASGASETTWARVDSIYTGVEAIAFGAAGALFGTTIQRDRAVKAERQADKAQSRADALAGEAERGKGLARSLRAEARVATQAAPAGSPLRAGGGQQTVDPVVTRHAALAKEFFPDID